MGNVVKTGKLLKRARQVNTGLTQAQAASAAGFSGVYWAQVESGIKTPPADTLARMSRVVGVTPAQLRKVGAEDAAGELEDVLDLFGPYEGDKADLELVARIRSLSAEQRKALFTLLKVLPASVPVIAAGLLSGGSKRLIPGSAGVVGAVALAAAALLLWPLGQPSHRSPELAQPVPSVTAAPPENAPEPEPRKPRHRAAEAPRSVQSVVYVAPRARRKVVHHPVPSGRDSPIPTPVPVVDLPTTRCLVRVSVRPVVEARVCLPGG